MVSKNPVSKRKSEKGGGGVEGGNVDLMNYTERNRGDK